MGDSKAVGKRTGKDMKAMSLSTDEIGSNVHKVISGVQRMLMLEDDDYAYLLDFCNEDFCEYKDNFEDIPMSNFITFLELFRLSMDDVYCGTVNLKSLCNKFEKKLANRALTK